MYIALLVELFYIYTGFWYHSTLVKHGYIPITVTRLLLLKLDLFSADKVHIIV